MIQLTKNMANYIETDILIIGAGLCGLTTAYYLKDTKNQITILESRERIGGRIQTIGHKENKPIELGATWFGAKHINLISLLNELQIESFEQNFGTKAIFEPLSTNPPYLASLPTSGEVSYRIKGGTQTLINNLAEILGAQNVQLNEKVHSISFEENAIYISSNKNTYKAQRLISTLPPNLLVSSIEFEPSLPEQLLNIASQTHTWMGESIKVALCFKEPFWSIPSLSGTILSNVGPIPEMYEHNNYENNFFALMGFLNGSYFALTKDERLNMILKQLERYYGDNVHNYTDYFEKVWRYESETFSSYDYHVMPHQNNGHEVFQQPLFDDRFYIAGSETSMAFPGYMDGAVFKAKEISQKIINNNSQ